MLDLERLLVLSSIQEGLTMMSPPQLMMTRLPLRLYTRIHLVMRGTTSWLLTSSHVSGTACLNRVAKRWLPACGAPNV